MGACRGSLAKHTFCYCCFSSTGFWWTHADIKVAGLEIGGQAVEGKHLLSEQIHEGNPIAPYLRKSPSSKSLIHTYMSREFVAIRADNSVCMLSRKSCDFHSRINTHTENKRICYCCERVCAENLPLHCACVKRKLGAKSRPNSPDFICRSCLKTA